MTGTVVSLRGALGLHTGWLVLDSEGRELGRCEDQGGGQSGTRGGAQRAVVGVLGRSAAERAAVDSKVKLGELYIAEPGWTFGWSSTIDTSPVDSGCMGQ